MKPAIPRSAAPRAALALGLALVAAVMPSASISLGEVPVAAAEGAGPDRLHLAQAEPAERPVTYAREQAERGEAEYESECEECHGDDLRGGLNGGPPLSGLAFEQKYMGLPATTLYLFTSTMMPPNSPGRFSESTYADLVAYILKENGFQQGAALPSDLDALDHLILEK